MDEVELKIALTEDDYTHLDSLLGVMCDPPQETHEVNYICDVLGIMNRTGRLLRVRVEHEGSDIHYILTYKGKLKSSKFKRRREIERHVGKRVSDVFKRLATGLTYIKDRKTYQIYDSKISLDHVLRLGHFIEIESPDEDEIERICDELGVTNEPLRESYPELMEKLLRKEYVPI